MDMWTWSKMAIGICFVRSFMSYVMFSEVVRTKVRIYRVWSSIQSNWILKMVVYSVHTRHWTNESVTRTHFAQFQHIFWMQLFSCVLRFVILMYVFLIYIFIDLLLIYVQRCAQTHTSYKAYSNETWNFASIGLIDIE